MCLVNVISWLRSDSPNTKGTPRNSRDSNSAIPQSVDIRVDLSVEHTPKSPSDIMSPVNLDNDRQSPEVIDVALEPPVVTQVERLGPFLRFSLKEIERKCPGEVDDSTRQAMADHFWCEILAQLAYAIDQGLSIIDNVPDRVSDLIIQRREKDKRPSLKEKVVKTAVRALWKRIQRLASLGLLAKSKTILLAIRILAVLACKQPERHQTVVEYCIDPLGRELLTKTKERLVAVLNEWLPQIKKELGTLQ